MEYEYQIISLPLSEGRVEQVMPMPKSVDQGAYVWHQQAGATSVLMHLVRLGWEPVSPLGVVDDVVHVLIRKRIVAAGRGGPH